MANQKAVTVFFGSGFGSRDEYRRDAQEFGRLLGEQRITLVYGGGRTGLMGELADTALGDCYVALPGGSGTLEEFSRYGRGSESGCTARRARC